MKKYNYGRIIEEKRGLYDNERQVSKYYRYMGNKDGKQNQKKKYINRDMREN